MIICFRSGLQQVHRDFLKVKQVLNCCPAVGWTSAPLNSPRQKRASFLKHVLNWIEAVPEDRVLLKNRVRLMSQFYCMWKSCITFIFKLAGSKFTPFYNKKRRIFICSLGWIFPALPMSPCSLIHLTTWSLPVTAPFKAWAHKEMT